MTAIHKPMPALIRLCVCVVWQRWEKENVTLTVSVNHGQVEGLSYESQVLPSFVSIPLFRPRFIYLSPVLTCMLLYPIRPDVWVGVNEGVGVGLGLLSSLFLPTCLLVHLLPAIFLMSIQILVEDGFVFSANHRPRLNLKCPLRESVWWEEGIDCGGWVGG